MARTLHDLVQLILRFEPQVEEDFLLGVRDLAAAVRLAALVERLSEGDQIGAAQQIPTIPQFFSQFGERVRSVYVASGHEALASPSRGAAGGVLRSGSGIRFDSLGARAVAWFQSHVTALVTGLSDDQREMVRTTIAESVVLGRRPRQIALDLVGRVDITGHRHGGLIGLSAQQAEWVRRARVELSSPDSAPAYLRRTTRDRRFDPLVESMARRGRRIPEATIEKIVSRMASNLLALRGKTIAQTEVRGAVQAGLHEAARQLVDSGLVAERDVWKKWVTRRDRLVRHTHVLLDGARVHLGQPFVTQTGARLMFPGDVSLGADAGEVVNCRCLAVYEVA